MKFLRVIALMSVVVLAVAACGGGAATTTGAVQPGPDAPTIDPETYISTFQETEHVLVDVREPSEIARSGVIPGAINIPLSQLENRVGELSQDDTIVVYCNSGNRSRTASNILQSAGHENLIDLGGIQQWLRAGQQLVPLGS